jgi:ATP-dependent helicase/nuclease subunit A
MSAPREIQPAIRERQILASSPDHSAWVAANAGSGKTHVLAQRVIRLLLSGVKPEHILCITFTKAAAANMANKVFGDLRAWTLLDDAALDDAIRETGFKTIDAKHRQRARQLFAGALETPGGLKVHTIHAFCTQLLHLFPFEANVAARFEVLDEAAENQMLERLSLDVMLAAAAEPETPLGRALSQAVLAAADMTFRDMVREVIRKRDRLTKWIDAAGGSPQAMAQLSQALGVKPADTVEQVDAAIFDDSLIKNSEWAAVGATLMQGSVTDKKQAERFHKLATLSGTELIDTYLDIFCTSKHEDVRARIATSAIQKTDPALCQRLQEERDRVWALVKHKRAIEVRDRSVALFTIAHAVILRVRAEKDRRGLLDYEDLIDKTLDLLRDDRAAWVHYKLDRGVHHVLIDEAQDTSPKQWEIVKALVAEFFAGAGAHERPRTIFAVGDEKQSIFSFQGAAPREFDVMRRHFKAAHEKASLKFVATEFKHSFRSGEIVLGAVDKVFSSPAAHAGLTADPVAPVHKALPDAAPGVVEIWKLTESDKRQNPEPWDAPFDVQSSTSGVVKLARRIASVVGHWQRQGRAARDVLILVRQRGALFEAIIRELKRARIPVAGADRLVLTEHIAVMDLMVLADALLLPEDDLALATVLRSPLFGFDEEALFRLAWKREGSLRAALQQQHPVIAAQLDRLATMARQETPFAFYAHLLGAGQGRKRFFARLGPEAADALDEFLNLSLDYERTETPSLQGFVHWLRSAAPEVKRDMEMARDEVRVMTVHGAKGLEAPIIILADTTTKPQGTHPLRLLKLPQAGTAPGAPDQLVWAGAKANDVGPMEAARESALADEGDEHRRLLYVAMTRAIERLIVCGVDGGRKLPEGCWYELVTGALQAHCVTERSDDGAEDVLRHRKAPDENAVRASPEHRASTDMEHPKWLERDASAEPVPVPAITPSTVIDADQMAELFRPGTARAKALRRGTVVHRLMQSLPDVPPDRRSVAAGRYLSRQADFTASERAEMEKQVLATLTSPRFASLFAPGSRPEVPVVGRVGGSEVHGVVDRLVVGPQEILIADYKTNRPAPASVAEAVQRHPGYVRQLALYRAVLSRLYPGRAVRAAIMWTDTSDLMEIPAPALDLALTSPARETP